MVDLEDLRRKAEAATPGPWVAGSYDQAGYGWVDAPNGGLCTFGKPVQPLKGQYRRQGADARFIAAANPDAILELIQRLQAAEADAERWKTVATGAGELTLRLHNSRPDVRPEIIDKYVAALKGCL